jgi:hypothetical protein
MQPPMPPGLTIQRREPGRYARELVPESCLETPGKKVDLTTQLFPVGDFTAVEDTSQFVWVRQAPRRDGGGYGRP